MYPSILTAGSTIYPPNAPSADPPNDPPAYSSAFDYQSGQQGHNIYSQVNDGYQHYPEYQQSKH